MSNTVEQFEPRALSAFSDRVLSRPIDQSINAVDCILYELPSMIEQSSAASDECAAILDLVLAVKQLLESTR